jgi:hypothetical protein
MAHSNEHHVVSRRGGAVHYAFASLAGVVDRTPACTPSDLDLSRWRFTDEKVDCRRCLAKCETARRADGPEGGRA